MAKDQPETAAAALSPMLELLELQTPLVGPVSLSVSSGECISVSGPSGSGKSLLLRAIADLDLHQGELKLDGEPATQSAPARWRRRVQLLPAEPRWWAATVGEHFLASDPTGDRNAPGFDPAGLKSAAAELGFPDDVLQWPIERLSSGERQRLALLRALNRQPRVLLLDEPTANLDDEATGRVEKLIDRYRRDHDAIVIWVSHNDGQRSRIARRHYRLTNRHLIADQE